MVTKNDLPLNADDAVMRLAESAHDVPLDAALSPGVAFGLLPAAVLRRSGRKPSPEKRVRILEAAVQLFTTRDYHEVLMEHVAEQAGVGKGTVYRYFPTKEALFLELVHLAVDRASEVIRAGINPLDPAVLRLRRAVAMTLEYFRRNEPFLAILYHDKVFRCCKERKDLDLKRAELRGFFARLLAEGIAEGTIRSDMEPALGAVVIMASIRGVLRNYGLQRTSDQLAEQLLAIVIEGVAPRSGGAADLPSRSSTQLTSLDPETLARLDPLASLNELEGEHATAPAPSVANSDPMAATGNESA